VPAIPLFCNTRTTTRRFSARPSAATCLLLLKFSLLHLELLLLLLSHRGHVGLYVGSGLQIFAVERNPVRHQLVLTVLSLR